MDRPLSRSQFIPNLAQVTLFVILLRVLGVVPPTLNPVDFSDLQAAAYAVQTSNSDAVNQIFWLTAACVASILIWSNPARVLVYFKRLPFLFLFLGFCVLSAAWATHPAISIRRSILLLIGVYSVLAAVAFCPTPTAPLKILYAAFSAVLIMSLLSLPFPFAFDERGLFRGVSADKNFLGMLAALALIVSVCVRRFLISKGMRRLNMLAILAWVAILPLTGAKTAIALTVIAPILAYVVSLGIRSLHTSLSATIVLVILLGTSLLAFMMEALNFDLSDIIGLAVTDVSFTGRDVVWQFCIDQWKMRWFLGFGYGSFWGVGLDSPSLGANYPFIRLLSQSHNGYLDVALAVGSAGLALLIGFISQYLMLLDRARRQGFAIYRFGLVSTIFILLHNITDSSLARDVSAPWILLLCASFMLTKCLPGDEPASLGRMRALPPLKPAAS